MLRFTSLRSKLVASTGVLATTLSGCSGIEETEGARREARASVPVNARSAQGDVAAAGQVADDQVPIPQYPHRAGSASLDARFVGNVEISGPCIYLKAGSERVLPIFPGGSVSWVKAGEIFRFAGSDYRAGSEIMVAGGEARSAGGTTADARRFVVPPPPTCDTRLMWFVAPA